MATPEKTNGSLIIAHYELGTFAQRVVSEKGGEFIPVTFVPVAVDEHIRSFSNERWHIVILGAVGLEGLPGRLSALEVFSKFPDHKTYPVLVLSARVPTEKERAVAKGKGGLLSREPDTFTNFHNAIEEAIALATCVQYGGQLLDVLRRRREYIDTLKNT